MELYRSKDWPLLSAGRVAVARASHTRAVCSTDLYDRSTPTDSEMHRSLVPAQRDKKGRGWNPTRIG